MFDFLKKKKKEPLLFTMKVILNPCNDNVLMQGCQLMTLSSDGKAYAGKKKAGSIPPNTWRYITGFCIPDHMQRTGYNSCDVEVRGEADMANTFPDPHDKPYIYRCGHVKVYPHLLPATEYLCDLVRSDDHLDIMVNGEKIGEMSDDRGRCEKLERMIAGGFQTTAQIELSPESCGIFVIVRKV